MKKVGIITTFRQGNFGSVLQAYALQYVVSSMGFDVQLIDYIYPNEYHIKAGYPFYRKRNFINSLKDVIKYILVFLGLRKRSKMQLMNEFIKAYIKCTKQYKNRRELQSMIPYFDICISGSDQIWNPKTMYGDTSYMLDFVLDRTRKVAYSSSISCSSIPIQYMDLYTEHLKKYYSIGVRELSGVKLLKELLNSPKIELVLDPTLLLNETSWNSLVSKAKAIQLPNKYVLFYMLAYTYDPNEKMADILNYIYDKNRYPVVSLSEIPKGYKGEYIEIFKIEEIGIYEFLSLFKNSTIVVTSSFHGTAFALNYMKPLIALCDESYECDDRIYSLLKSVGLEDQILTPNSNKIIDPFYDTESVSNKLNELKVHSLSFLKDALS